MLGPLRYPDVVREAHLVFETGGIPFRFTGAGTKARAF